MNSLHHFALLAGKENNESYTFKEMLRQPDAADFVQAMIKETDDHETRGHWEVIPRWEKPKGKKTVMAVWSFKIIRFQMVASTSTKPGFVLMGACKLGV